MQKTVSSKACLYIKNELFKKEVLQKGCENFGLNHFKFHSHPNYSEGVFVIVVKESAMPNYHFKDCIYELSNYLRNNENHISLLISINPIDMPHENFQAIKKHLNSVPHDFANFVRLNARFYSKGDENKTKISYFRG